MGVGSGSAFLLVSANFVFWFLNLITESSLFVKFYCGDIKDSSKEEGTLSWLDKLMIGSWSFGPSVGKSSALSSRTSFCLPFSDINVNSVIFFLSVFDKKKLYVRDMI